MAAGFISIIKETFREWSQDDAFSESASIAYYSILSLPGLLVLIVYFAGIFFGAQAAEGQINDQISQVVGVNAGKFIESLIKTTSQNTHSHLGLIIGIITISLGALAVFLQVQKVLNKIWRVRPDSSKKSGFFLLVIHRLISFALILMIGLFLILSMFAASAMNLLQSKIIEYFPGFGIYLFYVLSILLTFFFLSVFFAMIFKFLPDAKLTWKTVRVGASITSFLFIAGMFGLQVYFRLANPTSAYGAAGSAILILLWAYYSSLIFLLGAEFTKVYANNHSTGIQPSKYAVKF